MNETAQDVITFTRLVGLIDQLDAGIQDARSAWQGFRDGSEGPTLLAPTPPSRQTGDRLSSAGAALGRATDSLKSLADEIRSRQ